MRLAHRGAQAELVIWRGFIVLALLLLTALSLLTSRRDKSEAPEQSRREPPQPGYYMTDAKS